jgi:hypothetical protein
MIFTSPAEHMILREPGPAVTPPRHDLDMTGFTIDCDQCSRQHTSRCDDCVVTFICSRDQDDAVVLNIDELRTVKMLQNTGLVPMLRHEAIGDVTT